jgi:kynureninase
MRQITGRNIPAAIEAKLRSLAPRSGLSLNQTVIHLLETATGERPKVRQRDLSPIAAKWDDHDVDAFERATAAFESVDEEVWR